MVVRLLRRPTNVNRECVCLTDLKESLYISYELFMWYVEVSIVIVSSKHIQYHHPPHHAMSTRRYQIEKVKSTTYIDSKYQ